MGMKIRLEVPEAFEFLYQPCRYKGAYGGRGGAKSRSFGNALILMSSQKRIRILCARELQNSIKDSVHKVLKDEIYRRNLEKYFKITKEVIESRITGSEFAFKGLRHIGSEIKSFEGVDVCWIEEAQAVSEESWNVLRPTIRKPGSEIWASWNPYKPTDPVHQFMVVDPPKNCICVKVGWQDNPWFPEVLEEERIECLRKNPKLYRHIWEGDCLIDEELVIFKDSWIRYYHPRDLPDRFDRIIQSWDFAFKDRKDSDFVVGQVWGKKRADYYLLDQVRGRKSFTESVRAVVALSQKWPKAIIKLIEAKANGPAVMDVLQHDISGIKDIEPYGSKVARADAVSPLWETGNVYIPHSSVAPWVKDFVAEITSFPVQCENDDQVDTMTQALNYLSGTGNILEQWEKFVS